MNYRCKGSYCPGRGAHSREQLIYPLPEDAVPAAEAGGWARRSGWVLGHCSAAVAGPGLVVTVLYITSLFCGFISCCDIPLRYALLLFYLVM